MDKENLYFKFVLHTRCLIRVHMSHGWNCHITDLAFEAQKILLIKSFNIALVFNILGGTFSCAFSGDSCRLTKNHNTCKSAYYIHFCVSSWCASSGYQCSQMAYHILHIAEHQQQICIFSLHEFSCLLWHHLLQIVCHMCCISNFHHPAGTLLQLCQTLCWKDHELLPYEQSGYLFF